MLSSLLHRAQRNSTILLKISMSLLSTVVSISGNFFLNHIWPKLLKADLTWCIKTWSIWVLKILPQEMKRIKFIHILFFQIVSSKGLIKILSLVFSNGIREHLLSPSNKNITAHQYCHLAMIKLFRFLLPTNLSLIHTTGSNCLKTFSEVVGI